MIEAPPHVCEGMVSWVNEIDIPIEYDDVYREYSIAILDGGTSRIHMLFCPYCGAALPVSLRLEWFRRLRAMGIEPGESDGPPEYQTGAWWRNDRAFDDPGNDGYAIAPVDLRQFVLAMGLDGPVPMYTVLGQAQELTGDAFLVPSVTRAVLDDMLRSNEIVAILDEREPGGRWAGPAALIRDRLAVLLADDGPAIGAMIPGFEAYETLNAISVETSASTRAEAEAWVAENRELWDVILVDSGPR